MILSSCAGVSSKGLFGTGVSIAFDPRSVGTQIDDSIMQKNLSTRSFIREKLLFISKIKSFRWKNILTGKLIIQKKN